MTIDEFRKRLTALIEEAAAPEVVLEVLMEEVEARRPLHTDPGTDLSGHTSIVHPYGEGDPAEIEGT